MVKLLKDILVNRKQADRLTFEHSNGRVAVHAWGVWPSSSVLAGQECKAFQALFDTAEEAQAAYPEAEASHAMLQAQNTFDHLPDNDY